MDNDGHRHTTSWLSANQVPRSVGFAACTRAGAVVPQVNRLLVWVGVSHALVGVVCLGLLLMHAAPILGVHPALKPLKFAFSIAVFLGTMAVLLPCLSVAEPIRSSLAVLLSLSMSAEMIVIGGQALRGRRSHFNFERPLDAALTITMLLGILVLLLVMVAVAVLATTRPIASPALIAAAWRSALWLFLFASISGFAMGGRASHAVGGSEIGPGLPITSWSTTHGDLRVSHFFALHSLQIIPLVALALSWLPLGNGARWTLLVIAVVGNALLAGSTLIQPLASRPVWST